MSNLRTLVAVGPALCGAKNPDRWGDLFLLAFDEEIKNKESSFSHKQGEDVADRLEILRGLYTASGVDAEKVEYWIGLLRLCAYSYADHKGLRSYRVKKDALAQSMSTLELYNPEFAEVMSVADASVQTTWF